MEINIQGGERARTEDHFNCHPDVEWANQRQPSHLQSAVEGRCRLLYMGGRPSRRLAAQFPCSSRASEDGGLPQVHQGGKRPLVGGYVLQQDIITSQETALMEMGP